MTNLRGLFPSPLDLTFIIIEDSQGHVGCNGHLARRKEHKKEYDIENPTQGCKDVNVKKRSILLHKNLSDQAENRSH